MTTKTISQVLEELEPLFIFEDMKGDCSCNKYEVLNYVKSSLEAILEDYNNFLLKNGYTDADIYAEEPTALERYLENK